MEWTYNGEVLNEDAADQYAGFVYMITNNLTGKKYIGRKIFTNTTRKKVAGRKNRKVVKKQSNWKDYFGSNQLLKEDVKKHGAENFTREILKLCTTKGSLNYWELRYLMDHRVLESDDYYNYWISARIHQKHITDLS